MTAANRRNRKLAAPPDRRLLEIAFQDLQMIITKHINVFELLPFTSRLQDVADDMLIELKRADAEPAE